MAHPQGSKRAWHEDLDIVPRNTREYRGITVNDHANMIAGDIYGNVQINGVNHREIILDSLHFPGMERYHHRPLESHPGTFDWIFDQRSQLHVCDFEGPWRPGKQCYSEQECKKVEVELRRHASKLQTWLQTSDDIFWVQGKAGSGKSTFMKFLFEHQQTQIHLQNWAGGKVIAAAFFFWRAASSELEKSYLGLLRALLYQILQERRELIELVLPERWRAISRSATYKKPWTKSELARAFDLLLQAPVTDLRFCFFIDGLDEFDGDHRDLIDAIRSLSRSPFIKICVSSRPWGVFQREYGSDDRQHVTLHTLTKRDIDMYIATKLETAAQLAPDEYCARGLRQLANAVYARSEGVFLWVTLAVKDLRRGIEDQDSLSVLHDRLRAYPSELRDFIQRIFDSIDPAYKMFAGRLLHMMLEDTGPPALICLHFLEKSFTAGGKYIGDTRWTPKTEIEMYSLIDRSAVCANKWCKDLLQFVDSGKVKQEIKSSLDGTTLQRCSTLDFYTSDVTDVGFQHFISHLSFGHRSIHQFVEEEKALGTLSRMAGHDFDPRIAWLCGFVELSSCSPNLLVFTEVFRRASSLLCDRDEHQLLDLAKTDKALANGIQQCLEAFDRVGQNMYTSSESNHWTTMQLTKAGDTNSQLWTRVPIAGDCSSFVSYLVCLAYPDFLLGPILAQQFESLTELQRQFVLETGLIPLVYADSTTDIEWYDRDDLCRLGCPTHYVDIIVQMITSGIDVNRPTHRLNCHQDYSVWQFFLLWLHDYFHQHPAPQFDWKLHEFCEPEDGVKFIKDTTTIFQVFLQHGADPFVTISSVDLIECHKQDSAVSMATFLSVADVLKEIRAAAAWQLTHYDDLHAWLSTRLAIVGELDKLLDDACAQRYRAFAHASEPRATV